MCPWQTTVTHASILGGTTPVTNYRNPCIHSWSYNATCSISIWWANRQIECVARCYTKEMRGLCRGEETPSWSNLVTSQPREVHDRCTSCRLRWALYNTEVELFFQFPDMPPELVTVWVRYKETSTCSSNLEWASCMPQALLCPSLAYHLIFHVHYGWAKSLYMEVRLQL
jgi:hypothetical protein